MYKDFFSFLFVIVAVVVDIVAVIVVVVVTLVEYKINFSLRNKKNTHQRLRVS